MPTPEKTHTLRIKPQMSARYLADFMAATEPARRRIVRSCRFVSKARVIQHRDARSTVSKFIRDKDLDKSWLDEEAQRLRMRLATDDFERDVFDHNADYIERFASVWPFGLPAADFLAAGSHPPIVINGVTVTVDIQFRLRRLTKTNKVKTGAAMLRYEKGRALSPDVGEWQSAFILGYLKNTATDNSSMPERALCLTIDAFKGKAHEAPGNAVRRFNQMQAACETIAEWWPNIKPPPDAIY